MRRIIGRSSYVAGASLAAIVLCSGCAMMEPKAERYVAPPPGSTFVMENRNTGSFGSGTVQSPNTVGERVWQGKKVVTFANPQSTILSTPEGAWLAIVGAGDKPIIAWDPPSSWDYPLTVGKTWTGSYRVTVGTNPPISYDQRCTVEGYEDVTVPAGTFKAFKIACSTTTGAESTDWFSPELGIFVKRSQRRAANNPMGAGTQEQQLLSQTIRK
jgi:hypothetical protein